MAVAKKRATKKTGPKILPKVASKLIDIAVKDMRLALKKGWIIDMGSWYNPKATVTCTIGDDTVVKKYAACSACAAGAVMAISLASARQQKQQLEPDSFKVNQAQLRAIDDLRQGMMSSAAAELGILNESDIYDERQPLYEKLRQLDVHIPEFGMDNPEKFFKAMGAFSTKLKKAGY